MKNIWRRGRIVLAAAILTIASLNAFVSPALAGSIGTCQDSGSDSKLSGEGGTNVYRDGIQASIQVGLLANFGGCTPNDNAGINAAAAFVGMGYGPAFLHFGVISCNHGDGSWPAGLCNGNRNAYVEWHGAWPWEFGMVQLGVVDNAAHTYSIRWRSDINAWGFMTDGIWVYHMQNDDLLAGAQKNVYWSVETQDRGDGLGTQANAANVGQQKSRFSGTWYDHAVGSSCDVNDPEHNCVVNGSYGYYAYTVN